MEKLDNLPFILQKVSHTICVFLSQECEPPSNSNITAFALKAKVIYPINQKFRVRVLSAIVESQLLRHVPEIGRKVGGFTVRCLVLFEGFMASCFNRDSFEAL